MFDTRNDLPADIRTRMVDLLNAGLDDAIDPGAPTEHGRRNAKGLNFIALHELFDRIAGNAEDQIDTIAERVTALGGLARGTISVAGAGSLRPYPTTIIDGVQHVEALSAALSDFGAKVRAGIAQSDERGDTDTTDLFTGVSRASDKNLWCLEAHLFGQR